MKAQYDLHPSKQCNVTVKLKYVTNDEISTIYINCDQCQCEIAITIGCSINK